MMQDTQADIATQLVDNNDSGEIDDGEAPTQAVTADHSDGEDMDATQAVAPGSPTQQDDMDATQAVEVDAPASPEPTMDESRAEEDGAKSDMEEGEADKSDTEMDNKSENGKRSRSVSRASSPAGSARSRSVSKEVDKSGTKSRSQSRSKSRSKSPEKDGEKAKSRSRSGSRQRSRSKSGSKDRSRSRSKSGSVKSKSRSRSRSKSGSRAASKSKSRSRSRSKSGSRSRSGSAASRSRSRSKSGSRSRSGSRSKSRSRSRSGSRSSRSASRSRSRSGSKSRSRSRSRSGSGSDSDVASKKKKVVKDALGDSDDEGGKGSGDEGGDKALPALSDSEDEGGEKKDKEKGTGGDGGNEEAERKAADSSSDDDRPVNNGDNGLSNGKLMSDFDMMLERKRSEQKKRRKKKDIDLINDNDDAIARLIADMRFAAREDNELNQAGQPAIRKMTMLRNVLSQLKKVDLQMAFVEANVLSVMTDWLAPLPDKSLPSGEIRRELLKILFTLRIDDQTRLKESGIGKAVMYLYKHPKEKTDNKVLAGKIINSWARPIFNKSTNYQDFEKEARAARDKDILNKKRRREEVEEPEEGLRPGDPGWIARARVPMPAGGDYIRRPEWQTDVEVVAKKKKVAGLIDKQMRAMQERKKNAKPRRAVEMSLEGRKMAL